MKASAGDHGSIKGLQQYVKSVFSQFDADNSNSIDAQEFRNLCIELGYYFNESEVTCSPLPEQT